MKNKLFFINILYIFLFVSGSIHGFEENVLTVGGSSSWYITGYRTGVTENSKLRSNPVLMLNSEYGVNNYGDLDLYLSFDNINAATGSGLTRDITGRYKVTVSPEFEIADSRFARAGSGAALFGGANSANVRQISQGRSRSGETGCPIVIQPQTGSALFAPGSRIGDFTIEFWLYPANMENGEQIFTWAASVGSGYSAQRVMCIALRNRLHWSFENFFTSVNGVFLNIAISGDTPVFPKTWSHHQIRFDAVTGMLEYLVDGRGEAIAYLTATGFESTISASEVYTPVAGDGGIFMIGEQFTGMMDELKIMSFIAGNNVADKYRASGGRIETGAIDLGGINSSVVKIEASGGRAAFNGNRINNEFRENGRFLFSDDSQMHFYIRAADSPWNLDQNNWISFTPGLRFSEAAATDVRGRYVQIAVDFYPSANGQTSPYLEQMRIVYLSKDAPLPPSNISAVAVDGGVMLNWRHSPDDNVSGYLVYYGSVRGEYFGEDAALGPSPIDIGRRNNIVLDGLKNGTLYYFRVASYDRQNSSAVDIGEFSREVTARPLAGLSITDISHGNIFGGR